MASLHVMVVFPVLPVIPVFQVTLVFRVMSVMTVFPLKTRPPLATLSSIWKHINSTPHAPLRGTYNEL